MKTLEVIFILLLFSCSKEIKTVSASEICEPNLYQHIHSQRIITFGDAASTGYNQTSCPEPYGYFVAAATGLTLVNKSIDGAISDDELRAISDLKIEDSDIVVTIMGWNDSLLYGLDPICMQLYENNLKQILLHLSPAKQVLIGDGLTVLPVGYQDPAFPNGSDAISKAYSDLTRKIVKDSGLTNIVVVPTMNALDHNPMYYTRDQIHPNKMGQAVLAGLFLKYLKE